MLISYHRGQGSIVIRVKILNSSVSTGAGLTGLTSASSGLIISTIADNESAATAYTVAGSTIETITTLGTYAAPTATKCRFKELDATNHKGIYEIQLADARYAVSSAKSLIVSISGATNAAETDVLIPLSDFDPYDAVRAGLTALPNVAAGASGGLPTGDASGRVSVQSGTGTGQLDITSGVVKANTTQFAGQTVTAAAGVTLPSSVASPTNITAGTITTVTNLTNAPTAGDFTATMKTSLNAATPAVTVSDKTGFSLSTAGVLAIWHQLVSAVVTASTMGKLIVDYLDAAISSRTKPADTQAAVTLVTTTTNLTNAPTSGDLTATMKASVAAAVLDTTASSHNTAGTIGAKINTAASAGDPAAVWDVALSSHLTSGTTGAALNAAGAAGDPWSTELPGAYGEGTAGEKIGALTFTVPNRVDATVSTNETTYQQQGDADSPYLGR